MHDEERPQMPTDTFQAEVVADYEERIMGNVILISFTETNSVPP